jgi:hypothetical protein
MEENRPAGDPGTKRLEFPLGNDYEYDEAHDVSARKLGGTRAPHRVDQPQVHLGADGDYGYDEAHDFGAS